MNENLKKNNKLKITTQRWSNNEFTQIIYLNYFNVF